jgi:hypothetical protein
LTPGICFGENGALLHSGTALANIVGGENNMLEQM